MTTSPRDGSESTAKQEFSASNGINPKPSSSSWLRLKDPRIVRVSRAFGGKDRHSKVQTIKGLRDRRVRLSVSTAIQLYDLQDRLGLNQPSKVFDWLLHAAKDEIDELPPLQMQPEHFIHNYQGLRIGANTNSEDPILGVTTSNIGNFDTLLVANRPKEVAREVGSNAKENWIKRIDDEEQNKVDQGDGAQDSSSFSYPRRVDYFPLPGSLNYNAVQCDAYHHWEASNLSLSHLGSQGLTSQMGDQHTFNIVSLAPAPTTSVEFNNPRQFLGQFQMLTSNSAAQNSGAPHLYSSQSMVRPPFHLSMNPKLPN